MRSTSWSTDTYRSQVSSQRLFKMSQDKQYIACFLSFAFLQIRFLHLMSFCFHDVYKHSQSFQPTPLIRRWTWAGRFPLLLLVVAGVSSRNLRAASQFVKSTLTALCTQQSVCVCVCVGQLVVWKAQCGEERKLREERQHTHKCLWISWMNSTACQQVCVQFSSVSQSETVIHYRINHRW